MPIQSPHSFASIPPSFPPSLPIYIPQYLLALRMPLLRARVCPYTPFLSSVPADRLADNNQRALPPHALLFGKTPRSSHASGSGQNESCRSSVCCRVSSSENLCCYLVPRWTTQATRRESSRSPTAYTRADPTCQGLKVHENIMVYICWYVCKFYVSTNVVLGAFLRHDEAVCTFPFDVFVEERAQDVQKSTHK